MFYLQLFVRTQTAGRIHLLTVILSGSEEPIRVQSSACIIDDSYLSMTMDGYNKYYPNTSSSSFNSATFSVDPKCS
ncbi:hypothetical protein SAMN05216490_3813 [Mucilaginibacter mallensis]|uniref:Uncharacterized protein n=1 Tax=Mucilaginibacter mallensis TaxID=652787 RepID=A0A1H2AZB0_MUCMA|nr:hypothetical protein SAMN05216490_3813 [Mucilaginibacter mallensis]